MTLTIRGAQSQSAPINQATAEINIFMVGPDRKGNERFVETAGVVHKVSQQIGNKTVTTEVYTPVYTILTTVKNTKAGKVFEQVILQYDAQGEVCNVAKRTFTFIQAQAKQPKAEMPETSKDFSSDETEKTQRASQERFRPSSSSSEQTQGSSEEYFRPSSGFRYNYNPSTNTTEARPAAEEDPNIAKGREFLGNHFGKTITKSSSDYELLGLSPNASNDEVRAAYKKNVRALHPDKASAEDRLAAQEAFKMFSGAYQRLYKEPEARTENDTSSQAAREPSRESTESARTEEQVPPVVVPDEQVDEQETVPPNDSQMLAIEPPPEESSPAVHKTEEMMAKPDLQPSSLEVGPDDSGPPPAA